jgi:hypothetical protein
MAVDTLKCGIMGTFNRACAKYLPLCIAEFEWRYNNRNNLDIFGSAVARCSGAPTAKRLRVTCLGTTTLGS